MGWNDDGALWTGVAGAVRPVCRAGEVNRPGVRAADQEVRVGRVDLGLRTVDVRPRASHAAGPQVGRRARCRDGGSRVVFQREVG